MRLFIKSLVIFFILNASWNVYSMNSNESKKKYSIEEVVSLVKNRIRLNKNLDEWISPEIKITPLFYFSSNDSNVNYVNELLEHGADPNIGSADDLFFSYKYPLHKAISEGAWNNAKLLLKYNANPDLRTIYFGQIALHLISEKRIGTSHKDIDKKRREIARIILDVKKSNLNKQAYMYGETPLGNLIINSARLSMEDCKFLIKLFIGFNANIWMKLDYTIDVIVSMGGTCDWDDKSETRHYKTTLMDDMYRSNYPYTGVKERALFAEQTYALWNLLLLRNRWKKEHCYIPTEILKKIAKMACKYNLVIDEG